MYSVGTTLHIHVHILFPPIVQLQCKYLDINLNATQQDLKFFFFFFEREESIQLDVCRRVKERENSGRIDLYRGRCKTSQLIQER